MTDTLFTEDGGPFIHADFARQLERELSAALAERDAARECLREAIKEVETEPIWSSLIRDTLNRWRAAARLEQP